MKQLAAKLVCWIWGHRRGKKLPSSAKERELGIQLRFDTFACPRCSATWTRPAKVKA